jgi:UPF0755 protein
MLVPLVLLLAGCGGADQPVRVTIPRGSSLSAAADSLAARGAIQSPTAFRYYARLRSRGRAIQPGIYDIPAGASWAEILQKVVSGDVAKAKFTIPEGWTSNQIAQRTAAARRFGVPGPTLEGYLYPATYQLPVGSPVADVVRVLTRRYKQAWTPALRARADSLGMNEREVVTLASIIETEAKKWDERPLVSAVYNNRLRIGMRLQADPTVQYALGSRQSRLLYSHIRNVADHPYNTYTQRGLPPGPIASPSAGSIRAALYPADVPFLYFVARPDGTHVFTRTLAEHNAAKRQSQRARNAR